MKKFFITGLVVLSILLSPMFSTSFSAKAGRTQSGYGGDYCQCGMSNGPCYDEQGNRCDIVLRATPPGETGKGGAPNDLPIDYPSAVLLLVAVLLLTSRVIRFP